MDNRESLEQQLRDLEARKEALFEEGNADQVAVGRLNEQINEIRQQLNEIKVQEIVSEVDDSENPLILHVDGQDVNFRDWITKDEDYRVIAIAVKKKLHEMDYTHRASLELKDSMFENERQQYRDQIANADAAADSKYNEIAEKHEGLSFDFARVNAELALLKTQNHDLRSERDDLDRRLQAATGEIESLKQQLEATNNRVEVKVPTNLDGNLAEAMRKANESKRAIYNVRIDSANINYNAQFADNDEEFTDKVIYIGKYRQLSDEEAARFRKEREEAKQAELESVPPSDIPVEAVEAFRPSLPDVPDALTTIPEHSVHRTVDEDETGHDGESFEQEVRRRLEQLESEVDSLLVARSREAA